MEIRELSDDDDDECALLLQRGEKSRLAGRVARINFRVARRGAAVSRATEDSTRVGLLFAAEYYLGIRTRVDFGSVASFEMRRQYWCRILEDD